MPNKLLAPRTAIRQKVCALLRASLPLWDGQIVPERVYDSRTIPLVAKRLPAVLVYSRDERLEEESGHGDPGLRHRVLDVAVEVVALDDGRVDFLCAAVEAVMDNNETFGNLVEGTQLKRLIVDRDSDGETTIVAARMDFEVTFWTRPLQLPLIEDGGFFGGAPAYADDETSSDIPGDVILGITPGPWEHGDGDGGTASPPRDCQILFSTVPFIGKEYESHYEPAPTS